MRETLLFWLAVQGAALVAFPLLHPLFRGLPDRGYAFVKPAGLLLLSYAVWLLPSLSLATYSRGLIVAVLLALGIGALAATGAQRQALAEFLRRHWRYVLLVEGLFLTVLATAVFLRSFVPEIVWGEKPFELAFLNAVRRSQSFPPVDPWLAGYSINYYYFGYVQAAVLSDLTALPTSVTFYLTLCLTAALAAVAAFGAAYNLAALRRPGSTLGLDRGAALAGLLAVVLLLLVSNLEGVFELMARHGVGPPGFYGLLGIWGLEGPYDCAARPDWCRAWYPTGFWWWWKATRMGSPFDVQEFPFFSFQFGDLHPHVLALPHTLTAIAVALAAFVRTREGSAFHWWQREPAVLLAMVVLLGGLGITDLWSLPTFLGLLMGTVALAAWSRGEGLLAASLEGLTLGLLAGGGVLLLYAPFFFHFDSPATGAAANEAWRSLAEGHPPLASAVTRPLHFLLFWSPVLWLPCCFLLALQGERRSGPGAWAAGAAAWGLPLLIWAALVLWGSGLGRWGPEPAGLLGEARARWQSLNWVTLALLAVFLTMAGASLVGRREAGQRWAPSQFTIALTGLALLLLMGAELFFVKDELGWRVNTVFRLWYHAWTLLAVAGAYALHALLSARPAGRRWPWQLSRGIWAGATACLLAAATVYSLLVVLERTEGFLRPVRGLDGLAYTAAQSPGEYQLVRWLERNVRGTPVILEAHGPDFTDAARISSRTGLPTVLGWTGHELQWRGSHVPFTTREDDIERAYTTLDTAQAMALLRKYDVRYVVVGPLEWQTYVNGAPVARREERAAALAKFRQFLDVAFEAPGVVLYRVPEAGAVLEPR